MNLSATIFASAAFLSATSVMAVEIGAPAPAFTATDSNGRQHSLADFKGRTVVLEWTNAECPFVKKHYGSGNMQATQKAATSKGVVWLSVLSSATGKEGYVTSAAANKLTSTRKAAPTAVLMDGKGALGRQYGAKTTPHLFIINPAGTLAYMGAIDSTPSADAADIKTSTNYVTTALAAITANKPVTPAVTQPYGCSVKY